MKATEQAKGQNVYQHGLSVFRYYKRLLDGDTEGFKIPKWYTEYCNDIHENLYDIKTIKHYTTWHDCSKGFVKTIDSDGKTHYPDHAKESYKIWIELFPSHGDIGRLIRHDMDFHTLSHEQILSQKLSSKDLCTLMLAALSELHANAQLFGGIDSDSFKIKWKRLEKLGSKVCDKLFNHAYMYILVRNDLSVAQQAVQAIHAGIESSRKFLKEGEEHPSVVLCSVKSENTLLKYNNQFSMSGIGHVLWKEPDIDQFTALASRPLRGLERKVFSKFQLLT